ncbi:Subunit of KEOPS complex [Halanaeroarchaeum sp. HSR-CO]|uniref:KEOPS complex subunit Pcc1 n=1 Tax=Halanaeroarchaeum sp. HSR-CO TaxID=2866382 RepID=UPI00217D03E5|nr:KEOPS complex subunit Pcc1 [Halanaeroarchaeum sp. HSR-CO]UWG47697.1 Subunit of KEOPS complex [Halanaeroarchaeum sp. HSR-CO]
MTRTAIIRTDVSDPEAVAASIRPDNTASITTTVDRPENGPDQVVTTIERDSTSGLRSTLDDYVVNCAVADELVQLAERHTTSTHE